MGTALLDDEGHASLGVVTGSTWISSRRPPTPIHTSPPSTAPTTRSQEPSVVGTARKIGPSSLPDSRPSLPQSSSRLLSPMSPPPPSLGSPFHLAHPVLKHHPTCRRHLHRRSRRSLSPCCPSFLHVLIQCCLTFALQIHFHPLVYQGHSRCQCPRPCSRDRAFHWRNSRRCSPPKGLAQDFHSGVPRPELLCMT